MSVDLYERRKLTIEALRKARGWSVERLSGCTAEQRPAVLRELACERPGSLLPDRAFAYATVLGVTIPELDELGEKIGDAYLAQLDRLARRAVRDLTHRICKVQAVPHNLEPAHAWRTGMEHTYLIEGQRVVQAFRYDPEDLPVGWDEGVGWLLNWGGGRPTAGAFPQCAYCMRAGRFLYPRYQKITPPLRDQFAHVGCYCSDHVKELPDAYEPREIHYKGDVFTFTPWENFKQ